MILTDVANHDIAGIATVAHRLDQARNACGIPRGDHVRKPRHQGKLAGLNLRTLTKIVMHLAVDYVKQDRAQQRQQQAGKEQQR